MTRRPRIALDATAITNRPTGAGRFARNLAAALPAADGDSDYVALVTEAGRSSLLDVDGLELRIVEASRGLAWELHGAGAAAAAAGAGLLFTTREVMRSRDVRVAVHVFEPPSYRLAAVRTRLRAPKRLAKDVYLAAGLRHALRRAGVVTAGSEATAAWLRDHLRIDPRVILPALEAGFLDAVAADVGPERRYFLHLATGDARENTALVLDGFALTTTDATLVIAGSAGNGLGPAVASRRLSGRVELRGWVSDEELRTLYAGATALLHPTRYEGYGGYPALEAMALGTPVVGLRAPGATEALEGAAVVLERAEPRLLADALERLASDPELRETLRVAGRSRVAPLRWETTAAAFAEVFAGALRR